MTYSYELTEEQELLGTMMWAPAEVVRRHASLPPEAFSDPRCGVIWTAIRDLAERNIDPGHVAVRKYLIDEGLQDAAGGRNAILNLTYSDLPRLTEIPILAKQLLEDYRLRRQAQMGTRLTQAAEAAMAGAIPSDTAFVRAETEMMDWMAQRDPDIGPEALPTPEEFIARAATHYNYVIHNLIARQERHMLVSVEKAGKSVLSRQIALGASRGFFPFHPESKGLERRRVLLLDLETPEPTLASELRRQMAQADAWVPQGDEQTMWVWHAPGGIDLTAREDRDELIGQVRRYRPDLVMISPIYKTYRHTERDYEAMTAPVMDTIDAIRAEFGCAFWMEHHTSKAGRKEGMDPLGSSRWLRWIDFLHTMTADDDEPSPYHKLWFRTRGRDEGRDFPDQVHRSTDVSWRGWYSGARPPAWFDER